MSTRNLEGLLNPASVALIGASARVDSLGTTAWRNLRAGQYKGPVYAVNPKHRRLDGQGVYARIADLPQAPDLAVICTPAPTVASVVAELGARGTRAAVVLSPGLDAAQCQAMLDAARPHLLRILGPGCIGLLAPHIGLNASIAHADAVAGDLAFVSQSGSLTRAMLDWARARNIGFSHIVSLGERADVDAADMLDQLASDARTRSILLYIESVESPRKFLSAARAAARNKPVIVVRAGRSARDASADEDRVYDAAIARAGMLRVGTLQQMFLAAETLARFRGNRSEQLAILTNGSGAGAMAADAAASAGVRLCTLAPQTLQRLEALLARPAVQAAPLLIGADAPAAAYVQALQALHEDAAAPALLVIHAPSAVVPSASVAQALLPLARKSPPRVLGCWLGHAAVAEAQREFQQAGIASFATPEEAVSAFAMLVAYRRNQAQLIEAPPSASQDIRVDAGAARAVVQRALSAGRTLLDAHESRALLAAYGIAVQATYLVELEPYAAASAAEKAGFPVALEIISPDIVHGAVHGIDAGGVHLDLRSAVQVRDAARRMLARLQRSVPEARLDGFCVHAMTQPAFARELVVGARIDPLFGPVILFGQGGESPEPDSERAVALPPLNLPLARALVQRTRARHVLRAHGDTPAADEAALHRVLVGLSQLLIDVSQIAELDLSPLLVGPGGAVAMRSRVRLSLAAPAGALNFAIRPYPSNLVESFDWHGRVLTVRPIRPEDEAQHVAFLGQLDPADIRMRVFYSRRSIERSELARLTQIDYAREMAFVAVDTGPDGMERTLGVVRAIADPDNVSAEFGIVIRSDLKGERLGEMLMRRIIDYQRRHGTKTLQATVLAENTRMLELARRLGFVQKASDQGEGIRFIELTL
ncbi:MAG: GNAT family N-acetyltransferase [Rubrivivax sp.]